MIFELATRVDDCTLEDLHGGSGGGSGMIEVKEEEDELPTEWPAEEWPATEWPATEWQATELPAEVTAAAAEVPWAAAAAADAEVPSAAAVASAGASTGYQLSLC